MIKWVRKNTLPSIQIYALRWLADAVAGSSLDSHATAPLDDARTVPRQWVHRASVHEVFITDVSEVESEVFAFALQWPRSHGLTGMESARHLDGIMVAETVRQIGLCTAHSFLDVPLGWRFIARRLGFSWLREPPAFMRAPISGQAFVRVSADGSSRHSRAISVRLAVGGEDMASGVGRLRAVAPGAFARLRGTPGISSAELPPAPPSRVTTTGAGRASPQYVAVDRDDAGRLVLRVDPDNPFFFDHPQDHVPANLALEAARQVAYLEDQDAELAGIDANFMQFIDLDKPCRLLPDRQGGTTVVTFDQSGVKAVATVTRERR